MPPAVSRDSSAPPLRLKVDDLSVIFEGGATGLDSITLEVGAKQVIGVIGANGAGKTTLLNAICGEVEPTAGGLLFDGEPLRATQRTSTQAGIARTIQRPKLPADALVLDHVLSGADAPAASTGFGALLRAARGAKASRTTGSDRGFRDHAVSTLRELGLSAVADHRIDSISHAARARVTIARATIVLPRLLLLDEPGGGLGPNERRALAALIRSYAARPGRDCSVVVVDHHFDLIAHACDSVVVLDGGHVVARGTPEEVRQDPVARARYFDVSEVSDDEAEILNVVLK